MLDNPAHKSPTAYKLVTLLPTEKVLGIHLVGEGSDEMLQGSVSCFQSLLMSCGNDLTERDPLAFLSQSCSFAVAVKMGGESSISTRRSIRGSTWADLKCFSLTRSYQEGFGRHCGYS